MMRLTRPTIWQIIVHLIAWLPLFWLIWAAATGSLTVNPIQAATQRTGQFALILLFASLACTPANTLFGLRQAIKVRRTIGLYAFMYAAIHLLIFLAIDYQFAWDLILDTILEKRFIFIGASALIILTALAITSFRPWKRRLGKNWKRLHRLVYLAGILVVLHFAWARKGDLFRLSGDIAAPLLAATILFGLLVLRIPVVRRFLSNLPERLKALKTLRPRLPIGR